MNIIKNYNIKKGLKMKKKVLQWFEKNEPQLIEDMKNTNHNNSSGEPNPYHAEGDVWVHTLMVYDLIPDEDNEIDLMFAALLHDIGKTKTRVEKSDGKVFFKDHENVSTYYSIDILKKAKKDFNNLNIIDTLKLIAWHGTLWNNLKSFDNEFLNVLNLKYGNNINFFYKLIKFVEADYYGRILLNENEYKEKEKVFDFFYNYIPFDKLKYQKNRELEVVCLIGLSGSGKTTYIQQNKLNYEILSVDKYLEKGKLIYNMVDYDKNVKKAYNNVLAEMKKFISSKKNVIIDMTNTSKETRRKKISNFPSTQYVKKAVVFLNGIEGIKNNLNKRKDIKNIDWNVIEGQIRTFELPNYDEFDIIEYII